ncbi:hypothetical protein [Bartonella sp. HY761]|uniref:hypothetical protein n=1 Tax=Bartonella sp. HY761 TaxID=2979330 RepID=UPI0021FD8E64|nr:hypothetical protein [Bartonella sp. HY761]UXN05823.1 hypothetical protein N6A79_11065 [Bartonella sp. HY761]
MADFVGLLKKTIDAQSNMTPQLRQRIYERAKAAVERKLSESPLAQEVVDEQRAILQRAIDEVEAYYLAQEGLDELLDFSFDEDKYQEETVVESQPLGTLKTQQYSSEVVVDHSANETDTNDQELTTEPSILPAHDSVNAKIDMVSQSSEVFKSEEHSLDGVNEPAHVEPLSDTFILPIADQHRLSNENSVEATETFKDETVATEQARLELIEREREEERRIAAEQALKLAEDRARFEENERQREEERRIAAEQALKQAEDRARFEENERKREEERRIAEEQVLRQAEERAKFEENERKREEERRIAEEQVLRQAEERAKFEENERKREEERRIAEEQALKQAEERAKFEENERKREEERRIAEEQALKQAEERAKYEAEQLSLAQEEVEIAQKARLEAEEKAKLEEEAKIAAEASASEDEGARLAALDHAAAQEAAIIEAKSKARDEELARQASEQHLDAKEKAVLEVDARLSIEGAKTISPRKTENSNFDPSAYRAFDGNLDIAAERDIAGARKDVSRGQTDDIMPMPPLVRGSATKVDVSSQAKEVKVASSLNDDLLTSNDRSLEKGDASISKVDDNFDLVSDIFSQSSRREQNRTRSHIVIIIFVFAIIIAALAAGIYFYLEGQKNSAAVEPKPAVSENVDGNAQAGITTPDTIAPVEGESDSNGEVPLVHPPKPADQTTQSDPTASEPDKITTRLLPDGREVTAGLSQSGADTGSEGTSLSQATSIAQRSSVAKFYERSTSILPATASPGMVDWKLIRNKGKDNGPDELAIRGDIIIPEKDLSARITIRRNDDPSIRADFLIDMIFIVPENFDGGSVADIGRVLFKAAENSTGQELSGMLPVKVDQNFFIIAVSSNASGSNRNLNLDVMRQFRWIAMPVIYENGRVGEFVIDKGDFGDNIFKQVIDDWIAKGQWAQNGNIANGSAPVSVPSVRQPAQIEQPAVNQVPVPTPMPNNVPVPSTPANVPTPSSVPVPSAPPEQ